MKKYQTRIVLPDWPCPKGLLLGWKHIAEFLGLKVPTAKKWHYKRGMPLVQGPGGRKVGIPAMIYAWLLEYDQLQGGDAFKSNLPNARRKNARSKRTSRGKAGTRAGG